MKVSKEEIEAAKTPKGGFTRKQLAVWGVAWPPPYGWARELQGLPPLPRKEPYRPTLRSEADLLSRRGPSDCPEPDSPEFDSTKHGLLAPPRTTYRKL